MKKLFQVFGLILALHLMACSGGSSGGGGGGGGGNNPPPVTIPNAPSNISFEIMQCSCTNITPCGICPAPCNNFLYYHIKLHWQDNSNNEDGFKIYYYDCDSTANPVCMPLQLVGSLPQDSNSIDLGIVGQLDYSQMFICGHSWQDWVVRAYNSAGENDPPDVYLHASYPIIEPACRAVDKPY